MQQVVTQSLIRSKKLSEASSEVKRWPGDVMYLG
jgi:hypothetical protein